MNAPAIARDCPYVVLHHVGYGEPHFDLMIDLHGTGPLATWRCPNWPIRDGDAFIPLSSHRRAYLTYEGEISGGRGSVTRVSQGVCRVTVMDSSHIQIGIEKMTAIVPKTPDENPCIL